jgi:hypothetical protein
MSECIVMVLQGGIGNQLFQYCAGLAVAAKLGGQLWLTDIEKNKHSAKDYRGQLYLRGKAIGPDGYPNAELIRRDYGEVFAHWNPRELEGKSAIYLKGYFQYLPPIESQVALIREDLFQRLTVMRISLRQKYRIQNPRQTCFLHVRRGDYLKLDPTVFWIQDDTYFLPALQAIKQRVSGPRRWLILSDDIAWCRQQAWMAYPPFEFIDESDELAGLMLMSLCEGGAVISNSTYSWWGAMLGCGYVGAPVAYPKKWIGKENPVLFPETWVSI